MILDEPLSVALVGTGNRSRQVYRPLFEALKPWMKLVAVCDPVRESTDSFAETAGVPAFYDLKELVRARPMEAALVVTPVPSHHSIAVYLLSHGIPVNVETSMSSLLVQAHEMVAVARDNNTILRVGENFFRFPFDRMMRLIADDGFVGPIERLTCWHDHTGYHNNSRWISFFGSHPVAVQAIHHTMAATPHYQLPHRYYETETYRAHFFWFPDGALVIDHSGNMKSMLGRYPRPGYTELAGARGSIVQQATQRGVGKAEVRYCTDESLRNGAGIADRVFPIEHVTDGDNWLSSHVDLPTGRVEYINDHRPGRTAYNSREYYGAAAMGHLVDFAATVRGVRSSEYTDQDALMAMMMEVATRESAINRGVRLELPLSGDLESEALLRAEQEQEYGVDPLDIEGMMSIKYPQP